MSAERTEMELTGMELTGMELAGGAPCDHTQGCITCSDEGIPMRVVAHGAEGGLAWCADDAGERSEVMTLLVEPVAIGDTLLVHAGTALVRLADPAGGIA